MLLGLTHNKKRGTQTGSAAERAGSEKTPQPKAPSSS
jgi:hypothetical protein